MVYTFVEIMDGLEGSLGGLRDIFGADGMKWSLGQDVLDCFRSVVTVEGTWNIILRFL